MLKLFFHILAAFFGVENFFTGSARSPVTAFYRMGGVGFDTDIASRAYAFRRSIVAIKGTVRKKRSETDITAVFVMKKQRIPTD